MNRITLEQISELPEKEKRQLKAYINHSTGTTYAAQQRRKRIMEARQGEEE